MFESRPLHRCYTEQQPEEVSFGRPSLGASDCRIHSESNIATLLHFTSGISSTVPYRLIVCLRTRLVWLVWLIEQKVRSQLLVLVAREVGLCGESPVESKTAQLK